MTGLIRAEVLKLRTTRTFWALALGALALVAIAAAAISVTSSFAPGDHPARQVLAIAGPAITCALVLGVLAVTGAFGHGTITQALLITPRRSRLLVAKLITATAGGLVLGLLAFGEASAIVLPILSARHIASHVDGRHRRDRRRRGHCHRAARRAGYRHRRCGTQPGRRHHRRARPALRSRALLSLVPGIDGVVQRLGLAGLASGASGTTGFPPGGHILGQVPAALILAAYALAFFIAGTLAFRRRDLPG